MARSSCAIGLQIAAERRYKLGISSENLYSSDGFRFGVFALMLIAHYCSATNVGGVFLAFLSVA